MAYDYCMLNNSKGPYGCPGRKYQLKKVYNFYNFKVLDHSASLEVTHDQQVGFPLVVAF